MAAARERTSGDASDVKALDLMRRAARTIRDENMGAALAVMGFYFPEYGEQIREGFERGLERGRDAALDEEGIGRA